MSKNQRIAGSETLKLLSFVFGVTAEKDKTT